MKIFDTHIHCLPNLDDGAQSYEEAVAMLNYGMEHGIGAYICTPHSEYISKDNKVKKESESRLFLMNDTKAKILPGCEIHITPKLFEYVMDEINSGLYYSMGMRSRYYMLEFEYKESSNNILALCKKIIDSTDIIPVIAHIERYRCSETIIKELREMGCKIQMNVSSVTSDAFLCNPNVAINFVKEKYIDFLGTDAHRMDWRPPIADEGLNVISELLPKEEVENIAFRNAMKCFAPPEAWGDYIMEKDFL